MCPEVLSLDHPSVKMQSMWQLTHLMRTKVDVTRMENDVIIGIGDALSKQP